MPLPEENPFELSQTAAVTRQMKGLAKRAKILGMQKELISALAIIANRL